MEKAYIIPAPLLQATLEYLTKRPYLEVADAIAALTALKPAPAVAAADPNQETS